MIDLQQIIYHMINIIIFSTCVTKRYLDNTINVFVRLYIVLSGAVDFFRVFFHQCVWYYYVLLLLVQKNIITFRNKTVILAFNRIRSSKKSLPFEKYSIRTHTTLLTSHFSITSTKVVDNAFINKGSIYSHVRIL